MKTQIFSVIGMTCNGCEKVVHNIITALHGIHTVTINLSAQLATVEYDETLIHVNTIIQALEEEGYDVTLHPH